MTTLTSGHAGPTPRPTSWPILRALAPDIVDDLNDLWIGLDHLDTTDDLTSLRYLLEHLATLVQNLATTIDLDTGIES